VLDVLSRQQFRVKYSQITDERVKVFLDRVLKKAVFIKTATPKFIFPRDPKDEKYINLAVEVEADYIVSLEKELIDPMTGLDDESKEFRRRFRSTRVVTPRGFLERISTT
jgi:predicted nucleic acid-binding protein